MGLDHLMEILAPAACRSGRAQIRDDLDARRVPPSIVSEVQHLLCSAEACDPGSYLDLNYLAWAFWVIAKRRRGAGREEALALHDWFVRLRDVANGERVSDEYLTYLTSPETPCFAAIAAVITARAKPGYVTHLMTWHGHVFDECERAWELLNLHEETPDPHNAAA